MCIRSHTLRHVSKAEPTWLLFPMTEGGPVALVKDRVTIVLICRLPLSLRAALKSANFNYQVGKDCFQHCHCWMAKMAHQLSNGDVNVLIEHDKNIFDRFFNNPIRAHTKFVLDGLKTRGGLQGSSCACSDLGFKLGRVTMLRRLGKSRVSLQQLHRLDQLCTGHIVFNTNKTKTKPLLNKSTILTSNILLILHLLHCVFTE